MTAQKVQVMCAKVCRVQRKTENSKIVCVVLKIRTFQKENVLGLAPVQYKISTSRALKII